MKSVFFLFLTLIGIQSGFSQTGEIKTFSAPPYTNVERADIHVYYGEQEPTIILVLCPGVNGNARGMIENSVWQKFATDNKIGLVGLSFASPMPKIMEAHGYYYPKEGSGKVFYELIDQAFPNQPKVLFYGFSGGAQFTNRFVAWKPERVLAWVSAAAGRWEPPERDKIDPPGVIACGEKDERHPLLLEFFQAARKLNKKWLWLSVPNVGHSPTPALEEFVRLYFKSAIEGFPEEGIWVHIHEKTVLSPEEVNRRKTISGWLPNEETFNAWREFQTP